MEKIKLIICKTKEEIDAIAANIIAEVLKENSKPVLGLATGKSPLGIYENLIKKYQAKEISFKTTTTFNLDEYLGIKKDDHKNSYDYYMNENLFSKIDIDLKNVYFPPINLGDHPEIDFKKFEDKIAEVGPIQLQLLGLGTNGHIGFNEPASPLNSRTRIVDLTPSTIASNSIYFKSKEDVPTKAVSMGLNTILDSKKVLLVAFGKEKAEALKTFFALKQFNESLPMSALWNHDDVYIMIDELAASTLDQHSITKHLIK
ncbi:MAG: glucosamine-6-phosphate deaminase [Mycoplasmoidaceae bacterium]